MRSGHILAAALCLTATFLLEVRCQDAAEHRLIQKAKDWWANLRSEDATGKTPETNKCECGETSDSSNPMSASEWASTGLISKWKEGARDSSSPWSASESALSRLISKWKEGADKIKDIEEAEQARVKGDAICHWCRRFLSSKCHENRESSTPMPEEPAKQEIDIDIIDIIKVAKEKSEDGGSSSSSSSSESGPMSEDD